MAGGVSTLALAPKDQVSRVGPQTGSGKVTPTGPTPIKRVRSRQRNMTATSRHSAPSLLQHFVYIS